MAKNKTFAQITPMGAQRIFTMLAPVVSEAGSKIAARVPPSIASANSEDRTDRHGRPVALVALTEVNGLAIQAKHGTLTRAAAEAGADVHRYPKSR